MSLETLMSADLEEFDAETWIASLSAETNLAKIAGECIAVGNFNLWQIEQRRQRVEAGAAV